MVYSMRFFQPIPFRLICAGGMRRDAQKKRGCLYLVVMNLPDLGTYAKQGVVTYLVACRSGIKNGIKQ